MHGSLWLPDGAHIYHRGFAPTRPAVQFCWRFGCAGGGALGAPLLGGSRSKQWRVTYGTYLAGGACLGAAAGAQLRALGATCHHLLRREVIYAMQRWAFPSISCGALLHHLGAV